MLPRGLISFADRPCHQLEINLTTNILSWTIGRLWIHHKILMSTRCKMVVGKIKVYNNLHSHPLILRSNWNWFQFNHIFRFTQNTLSGVKYFLYMFFSRNKHSLSVFLVPHILWRENVQNDLTTLPHLSAFHSYLFFFSFLFYQQSLTILSCYNPFLVNLYK